MGRRSHIRNRKPSRRRRVSVRAVRRTHPDTELLSRALVQAALDLAASEAAAEEEERQRREVGDD